jgi:asparagine N-glycosylation enzyme membrane subunit Stt3
MFIWIAPTLYGSFWAVRFTQMLALPMAICAGIAFGVLFELTIKMIKKYS